jgi:excisionase family DNA binding protein
MARRSSSDMLVNETKGMEAPVQADELLTVHEVARRLRVDDTTVRRWINNGILEAITLPHSGKRRGYRVKQSTLDELLKAPVLPA